MGTPWLHEEQTWRGHWWLPEDPSNRHAGFLSYRPGSGVELVLVGGFDDQVRRQIGPGAWAVLDETKDFPVIHGIASNREVTLIDAYPAGSKTYGIGFNREGPTEQTIRAQIALIGVHVEGPDEAVFTRANFTFEDAWLWSAENAMSASTGWDAAGNRFTGEGKIELKPLKEQHAEVEGAEITLAHWLTLPTFDAMRGGSRGRVEHRTVLGIKPNGCASLTMLTANVARLQDLLALATGRGPALLWLKAYLPRPESVEEPSAHNYSREVDVYAQYRGGGDPTAKAVDSRSMVFSLDDLPFADVVPRWYRVQEQFRAACNMTVGARYVSDHFVETMLITAVAAAEAFHHDLKEKPATSRADAEERLRPAFDALGEEDRKWLQSFIPSGFSLGQRLERLAERLPPSCQNRLLPDPASWVRAAKRARHDLSHSARSGDDTLKLHAIMRVTRAVVLANILLQLGLSEERLLKALSDNGELSRACRLSAKYFPAS